MFEFINGMPYMMGEHHKRICDALDRVIEGSTTRLIINVPPRYGKTLLVSQMFPAYGFALNPRCNFLHLSYSASLTQTNSEAVKEIMRTEYFMRMFDARIQRGKDTKAWWETSQGGAMYSTSTLGQITGFGAGVVDTKDEEAKEEYLKTMLRPTLFSGAIIIDDPIKPGDALSDNIREQVNLRFETTIRNRVNSRDVPIIVIMQRLHEHDLSGYLLDAEPDDWEVLSLPAIVTEGDDERPLWEWKHNMEELYHLRDINPFIFETQYLQNPTPLEGLMYREFNTYELVPYDGRSRECCCIDPADTGNDFLCAIAYTEHPMANYIRDVIYTKKPIEYTEPATAQFLTKNKIKHCYIESNNGGRIFGRNVERLCREMGNTFTRFIYYAQTQNKEMRIFSYSNDVCNVCVMPKNWERMFPEFSRAIKAFRKEGRNANDDAPDCLTATVEKRGYGKGMSDKEILSRIL